MEGFGEREWERDRKDEGMIFSDWYIDRYTHIERQKIIGERRKKWERSRFGRENGNIIKLHNKEKAQFI